MQPAPNALKPPDWYGDPIDKGMVIDVVMAEITRLEAPEPLAA